MTLNLNFVAEDFNSFKSFEKSVLKQLGKTVYVGTNSLCLYFDYPKELSDQLRPCCKPSQLEFTLDSSKPQ